jgi:hypothetical protein
VNTSQHAPEQSANPSVLPPLSASIAPAELSHLLRQAMHLAARRQAGREALTRLPESLLQAISQQVAQTDLPLAELQEKPWAQELAIWIERSAYLLLISPDCQRGGLSGWSLDVIPEHQSYRLAPTHPSYDGVSLGFFATRKAALEAAAEWGLPFLEWDGHGSTAFSKTGDDPNWNPLSPGNDRSLDTLPSSRPGKPFSVNDSALKDGACIQAPPQFRVSRETRGFGFTVRCFRGG